MAKLAVSNVALTAYDHADQVRRFNTLIAERPARIPEVVPERIVAAFGPSPVGAPAKATSAETSRDDGSVSPPRTTPFARPYYWFDIRLPST